MQKEWNKAGLINHLAGVHGYRHYLEICTANTGLRYAEIDRSRLTCRRLMYLAPDAHSEALPIDYHSPDRDIGACLARLASDGYAFDIALIDPWHEYATSWRDLCEAFRLLPVGGSLVVHDCLPDRAEIAGPSFRADEWCGLTYQAFIDFVMSRGDLDFYTVDVDYGCGVVQKRPPQGWESPRPGVLAKPEPPGRATPLGRAWQEAKRAGNDAAFAFLQANRAALLNLVSVEAFLARESAPALST
jgi:hypothetical protein